MHARSFIDSLDFARNGLTISGEVPVGGLSRLQDLLADQQGLMSYTVRGGRDDRGFHYLDVMISGQCHLRCQRCLGDLEHEVSIETRLLLRDQRGLDELDARSAGESEEEFDSILAEIKLDVVSMLEDEILLSLPFAPKHDTGACRATEGKREQSGDVNPFAILEKLKAVK